MACLNAFQISMCMWWEQHHLIIQEKTETINLGGMDGINAGDHESRESQELKIREVLPCALWISPLDLEQNP